MKQYLELLSDVMENGVEKQDRTGTGTKSVFGRQIRFDLTAGFPMVTTKKLFFKGITTELCWFLKGDTNIKYLTDRGVHIWDEWADENGDLGPVYGEQWRDSSKGNFAFKRHDQIENAVDLLRNDPDSRRIIVSAWNVRDLDRMALAPCHALFQFYTRPGPDGERFLDCQLYQRSADLFLGVPFNIASYSLLTHIIAKQVDMIPGDFVHTFGDAHIYSNHVEQVELQLSRHPLPLPKLKDFELKPLDQYEPEDFGLEGYDPWPAIKGEVAV